MNMITYTIEEQDNTTAQEINYAEILGFESLEVAKEELLKFLDEEIDDSLITAQGSNAYRKGIERVTMLRTFEKLVKALR